MTTLVTGCGVGRIKIQTVTTATRVITATMLDGIGRFHKGVLVVAPIGDTVVDPVNASSINILAPSMC